MVVHSEVFFASPIGLWLSHFQDTMMMSAHDGVIVRRESDDACAVLTDPDGDAEVSPACRSTQTTAASLRRLGVGQHRNVGL